MSSKVKFRFFKHLNKFTYFLVSLVVFTTSLTILLNSSTVRAAEFLSGGEIELTEATENTYLAGEEVVVSDGVQGDLVSASDSFLEVSGDVTGSVISASGSDILLKEGSVGGSLMLASPVINIDLDRVSGAVRIAGENINLSGTFEQEVIVFGDSVTIVDAVIQNGLYIYANNIDFTNTQISGGGSLTYENSYSFDEGSRTAVESLEINSDGLFSAFSDFGSELQSGIAGLSFIITIIQQISSILFLVLAVFILGKKNLLERKDIAFNTRFGFDLLTSFLILIFVFPVILISLFTLTYQLVLPFALFLLLGLYLTGFYTPIYLANLIKNQFKIDLSITWMIVITYLVMTLLVFVPIINIFVILLNMLVLAGSFGYLVRNIFMVKGSQTKIEKNVIESKEDINTKIDPVVESKSVKNTKAKKTEKTNPKSISKKTTSSKNSSKKTTKKSKEG